MSAKTYRVVQGPFYTQAQFARAYPHKDLVNAIRTMGAGIILDNARNVVAFHESQLPWIERHTKLEGI